MEKFNRAERRAQVARLKAKRKSYWGYGASYGREGKTVMSPARLGAIVQHPQSCSCMGCGNQRRYTGRTLKEIVQIVTMKEEVTMLVLM